MASPVDPRPSALQPLTREDGELMSGDEVFEKGKELSRDKGWFYDGEDVSRTIFVREDEVRAEGVRRTPDSPDASPQEIQAAVDTLGEYCAAKGVLQRTVEDTLGQARTAGQTDTFTMMTVGFQVKTFEGTRAGVEATTRAATTLLEDSDATEFAKYNQTGMGGGLDGAIVVELRSADKEGPSQKVLIQSRPMLLADDSCRQAGSIEEANCMVVDNEPGAVILGQIPINGSAVSHNFAGCDMVLAKDAGGNYFMGHQFRGEPELAEVVRLAQAAGSTDGPEKIQTAWLDAQFEKAGFTVLERVGSAGIVAEGAEEQNTGGGVGVIEIDGDVATMTMLTSEAGGITGKAAPSTIVDLTHDGLALD